MDKGLENDGQEAGKDEWDQDAMKNIQHGSNSDRAEDQRRESDIAGLVIHRNCNVGKG